MKLLLSSALVCLLSVSWSAAQIPDRTLIAIVKAEDTRNYGAGLEKLIANPNRTIRIRAMLAAGRIGDERALTSLLKALGDEDVSVATMAAFAIGEIESIKSGIDVVGALNKESRPSVRARLLEAAGKIAGANLKDKDAASLGAAINRALEAESQKGANADKLTIRLGITAAMRARGEGATEAIVLFLTHLDKEVRADAGNAYARLRGKNADAAFRAMLVSDDDPICRANAARALGVSADKDSVKFLLESSLSDNDSRVRVSAVRALAVIGDPGVASTLMSRGEELLAAAKKSKAKVPEEKSELLEIAATLGRLLQFTDDQRALELLNGFRGFDRLESPEVEIAYARISPNGYYGSIAALLKGDIRPVHKDVPAIFQGFAELAKLPDEKALDAKRNVRVFLAKMIGEWAEERASRRAEKPKAPDLDSLVLAFAAFKSENISEILRPFLAAEETVQTRAALASVLGDQPFSKANFDAVKAALDYALTNDLDSDDAALAALESLFKMDKRGSVEAILTALKSPNLIVRRKALELLKDAELKDFVPNNVSDALVVTKWAGGETTKLGQVTNTDADFRRAVSRRNGSVKAVFTTAKGRFTISFFPEDAPLTVDNFVKLAKRNYFNGLTVHRVVPNFVMQDGDPEGNGNGGPGWSIRCEVNMIPYDRGAVGMALSGKDTGGSQWFATHSSQPHLDGGYTVFGRISDKDMKVVDRIVRGDKILTVRIVGR